MQRFELVEGTSSKFWEVAVTGSELTVNFGRIGTAGQSKTKSFGDEAAAQKERDKLVKEKTGKGYTPCRAAGQGVIVVPVVKAVVAKPVVVTADSACAPCPASAPASLSVPAASPVASATAAAVSAPASIEAARAAILWPGGGFEWKPEYRKLLPVVRGIHVPAPTDAAALLADLIVLPDHKNRIWVIDVLESMAASVGKTWTYWGAAESPRRITREALAKPDLDFWFELTAQAFCGDTSNEAWVARQAIGLHGLVFTLKLADKLNTGNFATGRLGYRAGTSLYPALQLAIASADEAAHQEALAAATALRGRDRSAMFLCSYLFPHLQDWAAECVAAGGRDAQNRLIKCAMPPDVFLQYLKNQGTGWAPEYITPPLLLQIHLHGEAVSDTLAYVLSKNIAALGLMLRMRTPRLVPLLMTELGSRETRDALDKLALDYPVAVLMCAIEHAHVTRDRGMDGWVIRLALREQAALPAAMAALDEPVRLRFASMLASLQREEAPLESLPALLREPPWLGMLHQQQLPVVAATPLPVAPVIDWNEKDKAAAAARTLPAYLCNMEAGSLFLRQLRLTAAGAERLMTGIPLDAGDLGEARNSYASVDMVLAAPAVAQLPLWNSFPAEIYSDWHDNPSAIRALLARHGLAAMPGLVSYIAAWPEKGLPLALMVDSTEVAGIAFHALRNLKKSRAASAAWLRAHQGTAMRYALPVAFYAASSSAREDARHGIRWFDAQGMGDAARAAATEYAGDMPVALEALLGADPLLVLPARMPKLPAFFVPASFRRPELVGGLALSAGAAEHVGMMLAISRLDAPYPGLDLVKQACTPASLAAFAWDLFEAWLASGAPSKESWAFTALGLLGNDETARRLSPHIREWPGESAHARAVTGLDLLAAIGTDTALMHLNGIAGKVKFKALQERAREKIAAVAEARGFTPDELADRLVPDMGLNEQSALVLDFGPRQFYIAFDEALKPFVCDAQGARLKDLPKPLKSDDAALAEAAAERYKQMKKDAKAIASLQVMRLEMGMVARRRWPVSDFRMFFIEHPLMRYLAARLAWAVYESGKPTHFFRVAEDWTLADGNDVALALPEGVIVGIPHVLEMPAETLTVFGQLFADYEILQPFRQLDRETYALPPEELALDTLTRFKDKTVATGSVMGLANRGWQRGQAQDGGWVGEFTKVMDDDLEVDLALDPGTVVGDMSYEPKQKLPTVTLRRRGSYDKDGLKPFSVLDPILISEVLRDIEMLAPAKD